MELPEYILGDHSQYPEDIFVIRTAYPRFIINLKDDQLELWEDLEESDAEEFNEMLPKFIEEAGRFYDKQMEAYED